MSRSLSPPFLIHTRLPRGRIDGKLDFLEPVGAPTSHLSRDPIKAVVLSQDLTQSATNLGKDKRSGCRGRASQWLMLHRPCNKTGTKPQLDPVAMLNATSEYFAFIFCKQHRARCNKSCKHGGRNAHSPKKGCILVLRVWTLSSPKLRREE